MIPIYLLFELFPIVLNEKSINLFLSLILTTIRYYSWTTNLYNLYMNRYTGCLKSSKTLLKRTCIMNFQNTLYSSDNGYT